jgi:hypothetical protein
MLHSNSNDRACSAGSSYHPVFPLHCPFVFEVPSNEDLRFGRRHRGCHNRLQTPRALSQPSSRPHRGRLLPGHDHRCQRRIVASLYLGRDVRRESRVSQKNDSFLDDRIIFNFFFFRQSMGRPHLRLSKSNLERPRLPWP